jgi:hypothetical protein
MNPPPTPRPPVLVRFFAWLMPRATGVFRPLNSACAARVERGIGRVVGYPLLMGQIALYFGIAWGVVGGEYGLTDLFWHDSWYSQFVVGFSTCWLFGVVLVVNTLLLSPRRLPGLPSSPDTKLARHEYWSLFPSRNPGVRRVGNRVLARLLLLFAALYLVKLAILAGAGVRLFDAEPPSRVPVTVARQGDAPAPDPVDAESGWWVEAKTNFREFPYGGGFVALGYVVALGFAYYVSLADHRRRIRERIAALDAPWLAVPPSPDATGPCCRDVLLGCDKEPVVPVPVPATVEVWEKEAGARPRRRTVDLDAEAVRLQKELDGPTPPPRLTADGVNEVRKWAEEARANNLQTVRLLHAMALVVGTIGLGVLALLFLLAVVCAGLADTWPGVPATLYTPAVFLALFLIAADVIGGALAFRVGAMRTLAVIAVLWLLAVNSTWVQTRTRAIYTFEHLPPGTAPTLADPTDADRMKVDPGFSRYHDVYGDNEPTAGPNLIPGDELLMKFAEKRGAGGRKPRLVLVATSGGAMRSAVWTALVLEGLEREIPADPATKRGGFRDHIRVIAGASGGMVGAAAYAADFEHGPLPQTGWDPDSGMLPFSSALAEESLSPIIQTALLHDFTTHAVIPYPAWTDRGRVLEAAWDRSFVKVKRDKRETGGAWAADGTSPFARPVRALAPLEAACDRPSLVFSPMMVEDSKRLLVSNLDLSDLTGPWAVRLDRAGGEPKRVDTPAVEFFRLFPDAAEFRVGTAARMSATFPILSPAVGLPTAPTRRLVDAGYYDNYGLAVLSGWLIQNRTAVEKHTSGVLVVQVRAFPMDRDNDQFVASRASPADALIGAISAPLQAVLTASTGAGYHRNSELIDSLDTTFNVAAGTGKRRADAFFATAVFELDAQAAMSWYLTAAQKKRVAGSWYEYRPYRGTWGPPTPAGVPASRDRVRDEVSRIKAWFGKDGCGP